MRHTIRERPLPPERPRGCEICRVCITGGCFGNYEPAKDGLCTSCRSAVIDAASQQLARFVANTHPQHDLTDDTYDPQKHTVSKECKTCKMRISLPIKLPRAPTYNGSTPVDDGLV